MKRWLIWALVLSIIFLPISPFIWAMIFWIWLITAPIHLPLSLARQAIERRIAKRPLI